MLLLEETALDLVQHTDGKERVLVDRVMVVHVVLHLRDDTPEIWDEATKYPSLVHPAQGGFGIFAGGENRDEQPVCLGILAEPIVNQLQRLTRCPQRARVDVEPVFLRDMKEA